MDSIYFMKLQEVAFKIAIIAITVNITSFSYSFRHVGSITRRSGIWKGIDGKVVIRSCSRNRG